MAEMCGSEVSRASSTATPPRSPRSMPAARARSSRGRMPAAKITISASMARCRAVGPGREGEAGGTAVMGGEHLGRGGPRAHVDAHRLDLASQRPAGSRVDLDGHQPVGQLDDRGLHPERPQRARRLEPEQPAADDHAPLAPGGPGADGVDVVEGAVHEHPGEVLAGHRGHEGCAAGGQHEVVVGDLVAGRRHDSAGGRVERDRGVAQHQPDAVVVVEVGTAEHQRPRVGALERGGEVDAVVGAPALLAEHHDLVGLVEAPVDGGLEEVVADHAVAHDEQHGTARRVGAHGRLLGRTPRSGSGVSRSRHGRERRNTSGAPRLRRTAMDLSRSGTTGEPADIGPGSRRLHPVVGGQAAKR